MSWMQGYFAVAPLVMLALGLVILKTAQRTWMKPGAPKTTQDDLSKEALGTSGIYGSAAMLGVLPVGPLPTTPTQPDIMLRTPGGFLWKWKRRRVSVSQAPDSHQ